MLILLTYKPIIVAIAVCYICLFPPSMAMSLQDAIRASLKNSNVILAARQSWVASRESIGSNTSTTDLNARLNSTGTLAETDEKDGKGFNGSKSLGTGITLSKNL